MNLFFVHINLIFNLIFYPYFAVTVFLLCITFQKRGSIHKEKQFCHNLGFGCVRYTVFEIIVNICFYDHGYSKPKLIEPF